MKFHPTSHFIPYLDGTDAGRHDLPREAFLNPARHPGHVTHDRYVPGTHSGRIHCKIQTITPVVAGGLQTKPGDITQVDNYRLGNQLGIAASSLRGMVSNLVEAASNSAMRVLDTKSTYSRRKTMQDTKKLSALGMVVQSGNKYKLWPLTVPTMEVNRYGMAQLPRGYERFFPTPALKVYLGDGPTVRRENYPYRTYTHANQQFFQYELVPRKWSPGFELPVGGDSLLHAKPQDRPKYVIGQKPSSPGANGAISTWGVMRVLGCWPENRKEIMPHTKKHELFLPIPTDPNFTFDIPDGVVQQFHDLADERTAATRDRHARNHTKNPLLPMEPLSTRPEREQLDSNGKPREGTKDGWNLRLKHGDLVYFGADERGIITEVSFSSIWRAPVPNGKGGTATARDFFEERLMPFDYRKKGLTPADLLMGFVEIAKEQSDAAPDSTKPKPPQTLALASRIQFTAALPEPGKSLDLLPRITRKILDSPKLPSPSMYFRTKTGPASYVSKESLTPEKHKGQGRKVYLHHKLAPRDEPWRTLRPTEDRDQKAEIRPIATGQELFFDITFDNLSDQEYGLLLYALSPDDAFQHKIGMGKALGLGSIKVTIQHVQSVNRQARYSSVDALDQPRSTADTTWTQVLQTFRATVPRPIANALKLLGQPPTDGFRVLQPVLEGQDTGDALEKETFRWFVANDNPDGWKDRTTGLEVPQMKQFLHPLDTATTLPTLEGPKPTPTPPRPGRW